MTRSRWKTLSSKDRIRPSRCLYRSRPSRFRGAPAEDVRRGCPDHLRPASADLHAHRETSDDSTVRVGRSGLAHHVDPVQARIVMRAVRFCKDLARSSGRRLYLQLIGDQYADVQTRLDLFNCRLGRGRSSAGAPQTSATVELSQRRASSFLIVFGLGDKTP